MNKELFVKEMEKLSLTLSEKQLKQFEIYYEYLVQQNKKFNLTAITEKNNVYLKHFYDSATIVKVIDFSSIETVLDIGTGAGFPGIVIKILFPHLKITLLDSNNKKITFLKELAKLLKLDNINFIHNRSEEYFKEVGESFDLVVARAVANLNTLSELCLPFVKINGYFIAMKGQASEEIKNSIDAINILGGQKEEIISLELPVEESSRNIIKVRKIKSTPDIYPRRYDKILKYPLKKNKK